MLIRQCQSCDLPQNKVLADRGMMIIFFIKEKQVMTGKHQVQPE